MVGESLRVTLVLPSPNIVVNVVLRVVVVLQLNRLTSSNSSASRGRGAFQKSAGSAGAPSRLWPTSNQFQMLRVLSPFLRRILHVHVTAHPTARKRVRRYERCLTLETTNRHWLAWLNPVSFRRQQHPHGICVFNFVVFEGTPGSTRSFRQPQYRRIPDMKSFSQDAHRSATGLPFTNSRG